MYLKLNIILFFIFLSGIVLGEKYKIKGELSGTEHGEILLLTRGKHQYLDTIGEARIEQQGKFVMEGEIPTACVAMLVTKNRKLPAVILLDTDKSFEVFWPDEGPARVKGGRLQQTLNEYHKIQKKANSKLKQLQTARQEAAEAMHMKTAGELKEKIEAEQAKVRNEIEKLVEKNRGNLFAAYTLTAGMDRMNAEALQACYARLNEQERELEPGKWLQTLMKKFEQVSVGAVAPDFVLKNPEGQEVDMYAVKGKLKILDFWASWCGPCRLENPNMVALYNDYKDKGLAIVSISLDNREEAWTGAIRKDGLTWTHLSSLRGWECPVVKQYGVDAVPAIFVLDENNRIIAKQIRGEQLRELVGKMLP